MYEIGKNSKIIADNIDIHDSVVIGDNVHIECKSVKIGKFSQIGNNIKINCRNLEIGTWLFMWDGVEIGRGGCNGPNSNVKIGNYVGIFENTIINPSESVEIGDNVGIGSEVMIWTHGAWLDVLQGFPADFGPVKIGNDVWLPARNIVLPNVTIGNNSVIGIGSIVNRDIPEGSLAAGSPCKVIKENYYPKPLDEEKQKELILQIIDDWCKLHKIKGIKYTNVKYENGKIILSQLDSIEINETIYHIKEREIEGYINNVSEDLRDYLRRRGIKIYTDRLFKSI
jgi:acetyltransferase-like isoleucine patch superfamily enzyme